MRKRNQIDVDLNKYIVLQHFNKENTYYAIEKKHADRLEDLYSKYSGFKDVPDNEIIECYKLFYDKLGDKYSVNFRYKLSIKINELKYTFIKIISDKRDY